MVVDIGPPQFAPRTLDWRSVLGRTGAVAVAVVIMFMAASAVFNLAAWALLAAIVFWLLYRWTPRLARFVARVTARAIGSGLMRLVLGSRAPVPALNVRIREPGGAEHVVRVEGSILSGDMTIGDDVSIAGLRRAGTLVFQRGFNHRAMNAIRVVAR